MLKRIDHYIVKNATKLSSNNKNTLKPINSCYYCLNYIDKEEIKDFVDSGTTALCSFCGIDAILPGEIGVDTLDECYKKYFTEQKC